MSNWARLVKSFTDLFSAIGSGGGASRPPNDPASFPLPRRGVGGFLARHFDRFRTVQPPPVQAEPDYQPLPREPVPNFNAETDEGFDAVEMLGNDASYDREDWQNVQQNEVRVVSSSNVYSYYWEPYSISDWRGVLYVTFLNWMPGMKDSERSGPGATYAYYDFPRMRYDAFNAEASASAGAAVWDFCRIRGTQHGHQHQYRLISTSGEYVPRKATARGFRRRTLIRPGLSPNTRKTLSRMALEFAGASNMNQLERRQMPAAFRRSTLPDQLFGRPDRGEPDRGTPNRGR